MPSPIQRGTAEDSPTTPYGVDPELDLLELGARSAFAYDEPHEIAYRVGAALGIPRDRVPLGWQRYDAERERWARDDDAMTLALWTLKHLAALFSDHPDYQESWRP